MVHKATELREQYHPSTVAVHAGRPSRAPGTPLNCPIVPAAALHVGDADLPYGRDGNLAWSQLEAAIGALEGGYACVFSSGRAAMSAAVGCASEGTTSPIVVHPEGAYSGTVQLLTYLASLGLARPRLAPLHRTDEVQDAIRDADILWLESPTNPLQHVLELDRLLAATGTQRTVTIVDNTVATPLLQRPLDLGADLVVHSASKNLAGHSDVLLGAVVTRKKRLLASLRTYRTLHGAVPGSLECYLTLRGLRTLPLRLDAACRNANLLAQRLAQHPAVSVVRHPSLPSYPGHEVAGRLMSAYGTVVAFQTDTIDRAKVVCGAVQLVVNASSLGGVETTIEHRGLSADEELPAELLRLSVGIEYVEDIWADLGRALSSETGTTRGDSGDFTLSTYPISRHGGAELLVN